MYIDNFTEEEHSRLIELLKNNPIIKGNYLHEDGIPAGDINKYVDTNAVEALTEILTNFHAEVEKARFEKIAEGGPDAILANVKEQMPLIMKRERANIEKAEKDTGQDLSNLKNFTPEDAADILLRELSLHVSAISRQEEAQQQFVALLIGYINKSKAIDGKVNEYLKKAIEEAILTPVQEETGHFLQNIKKLSILNDKINKVTLNNPNGMLLNADTNGQLTLFFNSQETSSSTVSFSLTLPETYKGLSRKISGFDIAILSTVCSLYEKANVKYLILSPEQILRVMNGKQPNDTKFNVSDAKIKKCIECMEKIRKTDLFIDITQEIENNNLKIEDERLEGGVYQDPLIECGILTTKTDKGTRKDFVIKNQSFWYIYNSTKKHVVSIPFELLDTSAYISDADYVTEFKYYLVKQIVFLIYSKDNKINEDNIILLDTIYKDSGVPTPEERAEKTSFTSENAAKTYIRKCKQADKEKIEGLLKSFKEKDFIKDFIAINKRNKPLNKGEIIKGYKIQINSNYPLEKK